MSEMMRDVVLVATQDLSDTSTANITRAVERAEALYLPWSGAELPPLGEAASLVIAGLPVGSRKIPSSLVELMTKRVPGLPLLLLTDEPLVRPAVSLQDDRVNLLGPPLTSSRIYAQVRLLLSQTGGIDALDVFPERGLARGECRFSLGWVAAFEASGGQGVAPRGNLKLHVAPQSGVTILLGGPGRAAPPANALERAMAIMSSSSSPSDARDALASSIGRDANVVHLAADGREWRFYWPQPSASLFLFSSVRLPRFWDLRESVTRSPDGYLEMPAAAGDVIGAIDSKNTQMDTLTSKSTLAAMADGAPVLLDVLENNLKNPLSRGQGLVVEVRK